MRDEKQPTTVQVPSSILHYAAFRAITWLAARIPLEMQYAIARLGADAYFKLDRVARESVCANLRVIHGAGLVPALLRGDARLVFHSFGRYLCEFFGFEHLSRERCKKKKTSQKYPPKEWNTS